MNEHTTPNATTNPALDLKSLDRQSDATLTDLIAHAQSLLAARETERKRTAVAEIKALAKANGLNITIEPTKKRRGRKRANEKNTE